MSNDLAILPPKESAIAVYSAENGLDPYLAQIRAEIDSFVPDVTTKKGRDAIASIAYKVAKSKTALDNLGKDLVAELKDVPRKIDAERKRMRDTLDAWKDEVRKPLTDFDLAEEARIERHKNEINLIINWRQTEWANSEQVSGVIGDLSELDTGERFEEFELQATRELASTLDYLRSLHAGLVKREEEQAELARLRAEAAQREQKEREERIAREAAENARIAAEQAAAAERQRLADEQARKDAEAKAAIERAEREKIEAENARLRQEQAAKEAAIKAEQDRLAEIAKAEADKQAAIEAERKRQTDALEAQRIENEKREKDRANVGNKRREAKEALMAECGLSEDAAKAVVLAITNGKITNISIKY